MRGEAPRRGSAPIATLERRLLWHDVTVVGDDGAVGLLGSLVPDLEHPVPAQRSMRYRVDEVGEGFAVDEEGDRLTVVSAVDEAVDAIYLRMYRRAFELASLSGWVRIHAVTVDVDGHRVLLAGPSGAGKTTLALRLLAAGYAVHGDESVLVRPGSSLPVPRAFHVRGETARLVPQFADAVAAAPILGDASILDPRTLGGPRRLEVAPVDEVVLLRPRTVTAHGSAEASRAEILQELVGEAFVVTETKSSLVATLSGAIATARCRTLDRDDPSRMIAALLAGLG